MNSEFDIPDGVDASVRNMITANYNSIHKSKHGSETLEILKTNYSKQYNVSIESEAELYLIIYCGCLQHNSKSQIMTETNKTIRGNLLAQLLHNPIFTKTLTNFGIYLENVHFSGDINLNNMTDLPPLNIVNCSFDRLDKASCSSINIRDAHIKSLNLEGSSNFKILANNSKIDKSIRLSYAKIADMCDLSWAVINGMLELKQTVLGEYNKDIDHEKCALKCDGITIRGGVYFRGCISWSQITFERAKVRGNFSIQNCFIKGNGYNLKKLTHIKLQVISVKLLFAEIEGSVFINQNSIFHGTVDLVGSNIKGVLYCNDSIFTTSQTKPTNEFKYSLYAENIKANRNVCLKNSFFYGSVSFKNSILNGDLIIDSCHAYITYNALANDKLRERYIFYFKNSTIHGSVQIFNSLNRESFVTDTDKTLLAFLPKKYYYSSPFDNNAVFSTPTEPFPIQIDGDDSYRYKNSDDKKNKSYYLKLWRYIDSIKRKVLSNINSIHDTLIFNMKSINSNQMVLEHLYTTFITLSTNNTRYIRGGVCFANAKLKENVTISKSIVVSNYNSIDFTNAIISQSLFISNNEFIAGSICITHTEIGGDLKLSDNMVVADIRNIAKDINDLDSNCDMYLSCELTLTRIKGSVFFTGSESSNIFLGTVECYGLTCQNMLEISETTMIDSSFCFDFDDTDRNYLSDFKIENDKLSRIMQSLNLQDSTLNCGVYITSSNFVGASKFYNIKTCYLCILKSSFNPLVDHCKSIENHNIDSLNFESMNNSDLSKISDITISGRINFTDSKTKGKLELDQISPVDKDYSFSIDYSGAEVYILDDHENSWPGKGKLSIHNFTYESFAMNKNNITHNAAPDNPYFEHYNHYNRIEWIFRSNASTKNSMFFENFSPKDYDHLAKIYQYSSYHDDAEKTQIMKERITTCQIAYKLCKKMLDMCYCTNNAKKEAYLDFFVFKDHYSYEDYSSNDNSTTLSKLVHLELFKTIKRKCNSIKHPEFCTNPSKYCNINDNIVDDTIHNKIIMFALKASRMYNIKYSISPFSENDLYFKCNNLCERSVKHSSLDHNTDSCIACNNNSNKSQNIGSKFTTLAIRNYKVFGFMAALENNALKQLGKDSYQIYRNSLALILLNMIIIGTWRFTRNFFSRHSIIFRLLGKRCNGCYYCEAGFSKWIYLIYRYLIGITCDYFYSPWKAFIWFILIFACNVTVIQMLYTPIQNGVNSETVIKTDASSNIKSSSLNISHFDKNTNDNNNEVLFGEISQFSAVAYTIDILIPLVDFGQCDSWILEVKYWYTSLLLYLSLFSGWTMIALFIISLTQQIKRRHN